MRVLEIIAIIGAVIGALVLFVTLTSSSGAPQEAAGAAIAIAFAVIPYCIVSVLQRGELVRLSRD